MSIEFIRRLDLAIAIIVRLQQVTSICLKMVLRTFLYGFLRWCVSLFAYGKHTCMKLFLLNCEISIQPFQSINPTMTAMLRIWAIWFLPIVVITSSFTQMCKYINAGIETKNLVLNLSIAGTVCFTFGNANKPSRSSESGEN